MAKRNSKDYIPSISDLATERSDAEKRAKEAADRGFRIGEYSITYTVSGQTFTQKVSDYSQKDAIANLKKQCGMVGWIPYDISVQTLVEPNIYV